MRVLMTHRYPDRVIAEAETHFDVEIRDEKTPLKLGQLRGALALYDGILPTLGDAFSAEVFAEYDGPRCKVLANFGVGYNHIDIEAARNAGVSVTNTPGAVTDATADLAMTLILMSARRTAEGERLVRSGEWKGWHPSQLLGLHVTGKTLGIIGMGRIGQAIAKRCSQGFDMKIAYVTRSEKNLPFDAQRCENMGELARIADIVVIALSGSEETKHMIKAPFFHAMQRHAHFVNVSRGDVIDQAALIAALERAEIAGAGLDVYEHEPDVPNELRAMQNVTLLPHMGTSALEVRERMGLMAVENLRVALNGETPPNLVN